MRSPSPIHHVAILSLCLIGLTRDIAHSENTPPEGSGSWWFKTVEEERIFLSSYPNVFSNLKGYFAQIREARANPAPTTPDNNQATLVLFLTSYRTLQEYANTHTDAELDQKDRPVIIASANTTSVRALLTQVDTFLRETKLTAKEIDTIAQCDPTLSRLRSNPPQIAPATLEKVFPPPRTER